MPGDHVQREKKNKRTSPIIIGWREWAALPELGIGTIIAKMDTGAKSSAIHAFKIKKTEQNGVPMVEFNLHPVRGESMPEYLCRAPITGERIIRSSNGQTEKRYVIETRLQLGNRNLPIELTLTNREEMDYRLLLGRAALSQIYIVDPNGSYLLREPT